MRSEFLTVLGMYMTVFGGVTLCSLVARYQCAHFIIRMEEELATQGKQTQI
jgi:hypothetical protein